MASAKYLGYVGGAAVAVGVGAALATVGQGTAHAETDSNAKPTSAESKGPERKTDRKDFKSDRAEKKDPAARLGKKLTKLADDATSAAKPVSPPKFDPTEAVQKLQKQFKADVETAKAGVETATAQFQAKTAAQAEKASAGITDLATKASEAAASLTKLAAVTRADNAAHADIAVADADVADIVPAAAPTPPPWQLNPLRPMPPEPAPTDMPAALWELEKALVNLTISPLQPVVREGYELGYRLTQFIPWVNAIVPVTNIVGDLGPAFSGDKNASQRIVNNLIVTLAPVSILYYGYDAVADLINLEVPAQELKQWFFATAWGIDFFNLLHNPGQSGIPLSPSSPNWWCDTSSACAPASSAVSGSDISLARAASIASTDDLGSDPFRANDPWPTSMPAEILSIEQSTLALLGATPLAGLSPYYREGYEAVYRASQLVPWVNVPIPLSAILAALTEEDPSVAQVAINQLLLTTPPVSLLYYGYDQLADLLNVEDAAVAQKDAFYALVWDTLDPGELLHVQGQSGLEV